MSEYLLGFACLASVSLSLWCFWISYRDSKAVAERMCRALSEEIQEYKGDIFDLHGSVLRQAERLEKLELLNVPAAALPATPAEKKVIRKIKKQLKNLS